MRFESASHGKATQGAGKYWDGRTEMGTRLPNGPGACENWLEESGWPLEDSRAV